MELSKRALLVLFIVLSYSFLRYERWKDYHLIQWDGLEYYAFLPQVFIEHDLSYNFLEHKKGTHWDNLFLKTLPDGTIINKRTIGLSICELPFFLVAHLIASISGYEQDGFSLPYQILLAISGILYTFIGLFFLRKILLKYFSEVVTSITLLVLLLGTNLWSGTLLEIGLTHPYSFMLLAMFIYTTIRWYEKDSYKHIIVMGLTAGMITLIRPTDILLLLFPMLFGLDSIISIKIRLILLWKRSKQVLAFAFCFCVVFIPQIIYWKYMTGHWVVYSYAQERFFFLKPHIFSGLFSYTKGWLLYTPVMSFALLGIFILRKYAKELFWVILIFTVLNIWIVLSWWNWWYGGSFGMRAFVESYAILALPLAAFIQFVWDKKHWLIRATLICGFVFFVWLNLLQSYQYKITMLHWECTSKELYWSIWGRLEWPKNYDQLLKCPDAEKALAGEE